MSWNPKTKTIEDFKNAQSYAMIKSFLSANYNITKETPESFISKITKHWIELLKKPNTEINKLGNLVGVNVESQEKNDDLFVDNLKKFEESLEYFCFKKIRSNEKLEFSIKTEDTFQIDEELLKSILYAELPLNILPQNLTTQTIGDTTYDNLEVYNNIKNTTVLVALQTLALRNVMNDSRYLISKGINCISISEFIDQTLDLWTTSIKDSLLGNKLGSLVDTSTDISDEQIKKFREMLRLKCYQKIKNQLDLDFSIEYKENLTIDLAILECILYSKINLNSLPKNFITKNGVLQNDSLDQNKSR